MSVSQHKHKRRKRDVKNKMIAGVCSGLAHYYGVDVKLIRIIFILALPIFGISVLAYLLLWLVMPA